MRKTLGEFVEAVDRRTGLQSALRQFLYEEIPASSGWHQVFGSVALFLILTQFFTGAMLAFNYAPTPGDAYNSLRYILTEVTAGRLMRGPAPLGRQHDDRDRRAPYGPGFSVGRLQKAARRHVDRGRDPAAADARLWPDRLSAALGQPRLLGNGGNHADRGDRPHPGPLCEPPAGQYGRHRRGDVRALLRAARAAAAARHAAADRVPRLSGAPARRGAGAGR